MSSPTILPMNKREYTVKRSKRKTLSVSVRDGEVTVKAPMRTPVAEIERFVARHAEWIERKCEESDKKLALVAPVRDGTAVLLGGVAVPIVKTSARGRIAFVDGMLYLPDKYDVRERADAAIAAWLKRFAEKELEALIAEYSQKTGLKYNSFKTTNARTKWGSCDGKCNVRLNWRLIMLDFELAEYVVVHELAHTVHHNHGAAFWNEVGKHLPRYAEARKRLKLYSSVTSLYRKEGDK